MFVVSEEHVRDLHKQVDTLKKEVKHWKANHDNMADRCAMLSQRPDLLADRIPAYQTLVALQEENRALKERLGIKDA